MTNQQLKQATIEIRNQLEKEIRLKEALSKIRTVF